MNKQKFEGFETDLSVRILEEGEVMNGVEGKLYSSKKDDRTLNYSMVAYDICERFDGKILEVCCGPGQLAYFLYSFTNSSDITATDASKEMILSAIDRYSGEPIRFERHNIHNHPYTGENDLVVCKDSFHHFKDPVKSMSELLDLLVVGGTLYIYDLARECPEDQIKKRLSSIENPHEKKRFLQSINASFTLDEMKDIISKAGGRDFEIVYPLVFSSKNLSYHADKMDEVKEHTFDRLSRICLVRK